MSTIAQTSLEKSVTVRVTTAFMACLIITCSCSYIQLNPGITLLYLWLAFIGSYTSYLYGEKRPFWLPLIPFAGAIFVVGAFVLQCTMMFMNGHLNLLSPLVQVLAGLQALHCFDLKTRQEFAVSTLIGIGLLTCSACLTTSAVFVFWLISYMLLLSFLLYFVSVSQTKTLGPTTESNLQSARPGSLAQDHSTEYRKAVSLVVLTPILILPVLSILVFFYFPRSDSLLSVITRNFIAPYVATVPGLGGGSTQFSHGDRSSQAGSGAKKVIASSGSSGTGTGTVATASGANGAPASATASGAGAQGSGTISGSGSNSGSGSGSGSGSQGSASQSNSGSKTGTGGKQSATQVRSIEEAKNITATSDQQVQSYNPTAAAPSRAELETIVFKVASSRPGYTRRITYDSYDGNGWTRSGPVSGITFQSEKSGWFDVGNANSLLLAPECQTVEVKQEITVNSSLLGDMLPTYWIPEAVNGNFNTLTAQADGSLRADQPLKDGVTYTVISHLPIYKIDVMEHLVRRSNSYFEGPNAEELEKLEKGLIDKYTALPADFPSEVRALAFKVAGKDNNWFVQAERISEYLHKNCKYENSDLKRMSKGDFVYNFLFRTREGNCVDFSSAFVTMCRSIGIPARMAGGYLPGTLNKNTGFYEVRLKDGHAWGEIYMPNWSWIPFDPTPSPNATYPETDKQASGATNWISALANSDLIRSINKQNKQANRNGAGLGAGIKGSKLDKPPKNSTAKKTDKDKSENPFALLNTKSDFAWLNQVTEILALVSWAGIAVALVFVSMLALFVFLIKKWRPRNPFATAEVNKPSSEIYLRVVDWLKPYNVQRVPSDTPTNILAKADVAFAELEKMGSPTSLELKTLLHEFTQVYSLDRFGAGDHAQELEGMSKKIRTLLPPVPSGSKVNR
ncbi:MAG: transglutaminaseTgpA domain-containing protein [Candidatus Melainabacteria bacterium]|nr:transglutaminaseTgpA domain-containing protein [Candidatus Melainabacteria bacterium]